MEKKNNKGLFTLIVAAFRFVFSDHIMPSEHHRWREVALLAALVVGTGIAVAGFAIGFAIIVAALIL